MKLNFSLTILYFFCLGIAMIVCPANNYRNCFKKAEIKIERHEEKTFAKEDTEVLHSELLLR